MTMNGDLHIPLTFGVNANVLSTLITGVSEYLLVAFDA